MKTKYLTQLWLITIATIACLALSAAPGYAITIYDDTTIGQAISYWNLNTNTNDYFNRNNATSYGPTNTSAGRIGGAYDIRGDNYNKIGVNTSFAIPCLTTISFWMYATARPSTYIGSFMISNLQKFVNHDAIDIYQEPPPDPYTDRITAYFRNSAGNAYATISDSAVSLNSWHHVALTIDASKKMQLYIDGNKQTGSATWAGSYNGQTTTYIGNNIADDDNFNGILDEVAIWNRALSENEIKGLYSAGFISDAVKTGGTFNLGYGTEYINELAYLYADTDHTPVTIGSLEWNYAYSATTLPGAPQNAQPGASWEYNGTKYILVELGSQKGLSGGAPAGVPEPATVVGVLGMMVVIGWRKFRSRVK